jgi:RimJ/RimL family protein N-acetyltransferase
VSLLIRALLPADAPAYRELMLAAYAESPDAFTSTVEERAAEPLDYWVARIGRADRGTLALGAFADGGLVGSVALERERKPKTAHKALLIGMVVVPGQRRTGAGRALMASLLDHAGQQPGLLRINLTVTEGNQAAIRLYEAFGFQHWGREPRAIRTADGRLLAKLHLGLDLRPGPPDPA